MRAVLCPAWGAVDGLQLGDAPSPIPAHGEVVIAVRAAGINYADAIMVAGRYQTKPPLPFSRGLEAAGMVAACGDRVTRFRPGDRVMAILAHGGLAELAAAPEAETFAIPGRMSFEEAGAFPIAYISSHVALRWQARLEPGETLLVLGAAGGGGVTPPQIRQGTGAPRVPAGRTAPELPGGPEPRYGEGKLRPLVTHRLPLEQSVEAIRLLTDRKAHGKVVVVVEPR